MQNEKNAWNLYQVLNLPSVNIKLDELSIDIFLKNENETNKKYWYLKNVFKTTNVGALIQ